jgi:hypothetical protein
VLARGSSSSGVVRVRESPDVKGLKVSVSVHHRNKAPSGVRVCLVEREERGQGVAILVRHQSITPPPHIWAAMEHDAALDAIKLDPTEAEGEIYFRSQCRLTIPP